MPVGTAAFNARTYPAQGYRRTIQQDCSLIQYQQHDYTCALHARRRWGTAAYKCIIILCYLNTTATSGLKP
jgi:hypothetical protein